MPDVHSFAAIPEFSTRVSGDDEGSTGGHPSSNDIAFKCFVNNIKWPHLYSPHELPKDLTRPYPPSHIGSESLAFLHNTVNINSHTMGSSHLSDEIRHSEY